MSTGAREREGGVGTGMAPGSRGTALIYCRVSTKRQEEEGTSLDSQAEACIQLAQEQGYTIGQITKEVYSGAELYDRPLLARDRAALHQGRYQALIAYSTDRLSRDPIHLAIIMQECMRDNVELLFVTEPLDTSDEGQLISYVKGYANKLERARIRERHLRGKRQRALSGKIHNYGPELYGYRRNRAAGTRVIYEPEATVVRRIFTWVADEHLGIVGVAKRLNDESVPPPSAGKMTYPDPDRVPRWGKNQVRKLLHHPACKGETFAWRTQRPRSIKDRKRPDFDSEESRIIRPESEWIRLPDGVTPAIVSADLWQRAQDALASRTAVLATRNAARPYLLRGMVWCSLCGKRMYGSIENARTTHTARIYRCSSRHSAQGACGGKRIPADALESWVWEQVSNLLRHPDLIAAELQRHRDAGPDQTLASDLETARRTLARHEKKQAMLLQRFTSSEDDSFPWELVEREITRLEREKEQWRAVIADIEQRLAQQEHTLEQLDALRTFCERVSYRLDTFEFAEKRIALEALRIRVTGQGREWVLYGDILLENEPDSGTGMPQSEANGGNGDSGVSDHNVSKLWPPLAATSSARFTCSCPRTSARS